VTVDLDARLVTAADARIPFQIDDQVRWMLMNGLDDIGLTARRAGSIDAYERTRPRWLPSLAAR
jgi:3-isopropylmalate/(R)-2-methylmalate dehydratase small subunit